MIKAAKDAAAAAARAAAKKAKDLKDAAAKAACDALRATAKAALHVAEQAVKLPARALDGAKLALKGVLAAQHAAFAIFKMFASILPAIKLLKFSVTLMGAVIPAAFDFHIKLNIAGKDFDLRLRLNLADLAGMVKPLVDKAIAYLKSKISIPSISSFLGEEFLQDEEIVRKSTAEVEFLLQELDTGDFETGPAVM
jgi:hypothetical protein